MAMKCKCGRGAIYKTISPNKKTPIYNCAKHIPPINNPKYKITFRLAPKGRFDMRAVAGNVRRRR